VVRNRNVIRLVLVVAVFAVGCGYGMFAERTQRFPFRLTRKVLSLSVATPATAAMPPSPRRAAGTARDPGRWGANSRRSSRRS